MSELAPRRVEIAAPAKLNLGLEVLGKREDGYHELATIFMAVNLCDRLTVTVPRAAVTASSRSGEPGGSGTALTCTDPLLERFDNLILRALDALRDETGFPGGAYVHLEKRVPLASGLGGASSDAAAALLAARELWSLNLSDERLAEVAATIGSDVPFFLRGGCVLGRGRGEILESLPVPRGLRFVLVVPDVVIANKTARLYQMLSPADLSDGSRVLAQANRLRGGLALDPALLGNAFSRPLEALVPEVREVRAILGQAGAPIVALSGAGPAHYVPVFDRDEAERIAGTVRSTLGDRARVDVVSPLKARA